MLMPLFFFVLNRPEIGVLVNQTELSICWCSKQEMKTILASIVIYIQAKAETKTQQQRQR